MKIAIVNKFFFLKGGQESVMLEEGKLLEKAGHEVAYFSMHHPNNPANYKYSKYFADYVEFSNAGKEYSLIEKLKIAKKFIWNKQAEVKFEEFLQDFQPDIIHCHGISHQITPSILTVAKKHKIPVVQTLHDYQLICPSYSLLLKGTQICVDKKCSTGNYYNCIFNKCVKSSDLASLLSSLEMYFNDYNNKYINMIDKFIAPSNFLKNTMISSGKPEEKFIHIPNFINVSEYEPKYVNKSYFIYVGRLSAEKGLNTLLSAFKDMPNANLKIIGTGLLEKELKSFSSLNKINNVEFLGYKSGEELKELYKNCIASIVPSEWYENLPMAIVESLAYGKPVIASGLGGIPEMVINGINGYTFEAFNAADLKVQINKFIQNSGLSKELGINAREFAEQNYSEKIHLKKLLETYKSAIEQSLLSSK